MKKTHAIDQENEEKQFQLKSIGKENEFSFACYPGISCFNRCCHEIDVALTPFDVLRIKRRLGILSDEFLAKYSQLLSYKGSDLPLLKIKAQDEKTGRCMFLGNRGCSIYEDRPLVCRNYPTGVATQDPREDQEDQPHFIIEETICKGHLENKLWTLADWKKNQNALELEELNDPWLKIVARLKSLKLKDDKDQKMNIFILVSFDQDAFRSFVFDSKFLSRFDVDKATVKAIREDEEQLLKFGFQWLEFALFGEGPVKLRP